MNQELLQQLSVITEEEKNYLNGASDVVNELYFTNSNHTVDSGKLLQKGRLIEIRPHTRFVHFPKHSHNYVEMIYMCKGQTTHILNDTDEIKLTDGDLLFLNQHVTQEILPAGENDIAINFIILPEFFDTTLSMISEENILRDFVISTLSGDSAYSTYMHFHAKDILPVQNLLENMIWTLFQPKHGTNPNSINQTTMGLLLMNLSSYANDISYESSKSFEQNAIYSILKYIDSHYKSGTLSEVAEELNQPTYYVSKLLKKYTGHNFKELLQERKLQQAAYYLNQTTMTVESIMDSIGYENSSYFYKKFKEKYGQSPREYKLSEKL